MSAALARIEQIIDAAGVAERTEALLPIGVRPRQLTVRTLLIGILLTRHGRPGHLRKVHQALIALPEDEQRRLGVIAQWKGAPHQLSYRQLEYTFGLVRRKLEKQTPDGSPSPLLSEFPDAQLEASVTVLVGEPQSSSYAVDWTDHETWSNPPRKRHARTDEGERGQATSRDADQDPPRQDHNADPEPATDNTDEDPRTRCADPEASWGTGAATHPARRTSVSTATTCRRSQSSRTSTAPRCQNSCGASTSPPAITTPHPRWCPSSSGWPPTGSSSQTSSPTPATLPRAGQLGAPVRRLGAQLVQDLHPNDRGTQGTHEGAIRLNGNLYCPATPQALFELSPPPPGANASKIAAHDQRSDELARYKFGRITHDQDGYHRAGCPATQGKPRCPLRPSSTGLDHTRPQVLKAPEQPPKCCSQQTITVPPQVSLTSAPARWMRRLRTLLEAASPVDASTAGRAIRAEAVTQDGVRVVLFEDTSSDHIVAPSGHPELVAHLDAVMATVSSPDHREPDLQPQRERFFKQDVGPSRWLMLVVSFEQEPARVVTALGYGHGRSPRGWIS